MAGVVTMVALGAAACGGGDDGDDVTIEATPAALAEAAGRSAEEPYRFEASITMRASGGGQTLDVDAPLGTGEHEGDAFEVQMDMGPMMEQVMGTALGSAGDAPDGGSLPGLPDTGALTMEMAGNRETLYIRAPIFAALAQSGTPGAGLGALAELASLGDKWGRVDLNDLGTLSIAELQSTAGAPTGSDPRAMLELIAHAEDVEDLGTDEIGGTEVTGLGADLSLGEMLEAQGVEPEEFLDVMAANVGTSLDASSPDAGEILETALQAEMPFEVWVDDRGFVRRLAFEMDVVDMLASAGAQPPGIDELTIGSTMDFSDYGDESIEIELPSDAEAVDATDAYRRLLEAGSAMGATGA